MPPLKDRIIQALYGGTLVTVSLGSITACGVDDLPNGDGSNTNSTNTASTSGTSGTTGTTPTTGTITGSTNTTATLPPPDKAGACGAEQYERLDYTTWRAQVGEDFDSPDQRYIVCQGPSSTQRCEDPARWTSDQKSTFVQQALSEPFSNGCDNPNSVRYSDRVGSTFCGPFDWQGKTCCHVIELSFGFCLEGRPFTVDGVARLAHVVERQGWTDAIELSGVESLSPKLRHEIAAHWAESGVHEHASVASFGRFLLDLMSLGAPRRLVTAATKAIDDEIRHASACFAIASVYAQKPLGPAEVDMTGSMEHAGDAAKILEAAILEGCIGETLAASMAGWQTGQVADESMRQVLDQITQEESDHALLSWESVKWLLKAHPDLIPRAKAIFAAAFEPEQSSWARGISPQERVTIAHGKVRAGTEDHLRRRAYHQIVLPCAQALFDSLDNEASVTHRA